MIRLEKRKFITGEGTLSSQDNTVRQNQQGWDEYDWSKSGEEWTEDVQRYRGIDAAEWKRRLVEGVLLERIPEGGATIEVGPGAGRWTEFLQPRSKRLFLVDVSQKCLDLCRERFGACDNLEYHRLDDQRLGFAADKSIDSIWSYDVFVHINPTDTERYFVEFARVLRPGGVGVIHHPGDEMNDETREEGWRSHLQGRFVAHLVEKLGMEILEQNSEFPHHPGDLITVFRQPA